MEASYGEKRLFRWEAHESEAPSEPYTTTRAAVGFILRPVRAWEHRISQTLEYSDPHVWREFSTQIADLPTQLSFAVVQAPNASCAPPLGKMAGITVDEYGEWLWIHRIGDCDRVLDWLWKFFSARLDNRLELALNAGGWQAAAEMCEGLAEWFRLRSTDSKGPVRDLVLPPSVKGPGYEEAVERVNAVLRLMPDSELTVEGLPIDDELLRASYHYNALSKEYRQRRELRGLNGYWEGAWGRFILAIDEAKATAYATLPRASRSTESPRGETASIDGYFAGGYADKLRAAYAKDPARYRGRRRAAFKALRTAAKVSESEERTVKRALGYEGAESKGFDVFICMLFEASGESVPE